MSGNRRVTFPLTKAALFSSAEVKINTFHAYFSYRGVQLHLIKWKLPIEMKEITVVVKNLQICKKMQYCSTIKIRGQKSQPVTILGLQCSIVLSLFLLTAILLLLFNLA